MISLNFREYDNQFFTSEATLSTLNSTSEVLICTSELTVEFTTEFHHHFQSDHADLSDYFIDMFKQLLKKTSICSISANFQFKHIIQKKQTRIQSDQ